VKSRSGCVQCGANAPRISSRRDSRQGTASAAGPTAAPVHRAEHSSKVPSSKLQSPKNFQAPIPKRVNWNPFPVKLFAAVGTHRPGTARRATTGGQQSARPAGRGPPWGGCPACSSATWPRHCRCSGAVGSRLQNNKT
jgi:hypothetical protein